MDKKIRNEIMQKVEEHLRKNMRVGMGHHPPEVVNKAIEIALDDSINYYDKIIDDIKRTGKPKKKSLFFKSKEEKEERKEEPDVVRDPDPAPLIREVGEPPAPPKSDYSKPLRNEFIGSPTPQPTFEVAPKQPPREYYQPPQPEPRYYQPPQQQQPQPHYLHRNEQNLNRPHQEMQQQPVASPGYSQPQARQEYNPNYPQQQRYPEPPREQPPVRYPQQQPYYEDNYPPPEEQFNYEREDYIGDLEDPRTVKISGRILDRRD